MQLSLGWVCVLHQKLLITVNCSFKCAYNGQIAHDYKIPYHGCGRIWARGQLCEIMAFGESWLTSVQPKGPLFRKFAADNTITVECETWVEPSLAWAISYNRWNVCLRHHLFSPSCSFILLNQQVIHVTNGTYHSWRTNLWTNETDGHIMDLKIGCLLPILSGEPSSDCKGGAWIGFPLILLCQ